MAPAAAGSAPCLRAAPPPPDGRDLAPAGTVEDVAPPLQADFPCYRLANDLAHAGDFHVEGVERNQRVPMLGGGKQGGEKAVLVRRAQQRLAMGECILHGRASRFRSSRALAAHPRAKFRTQKDTSKLMIVAWGGLRLHVRGLRFLRRLLGFHA